MKILVAILMSCLCLVVNAQHSSENIVKECFAVEAEQEIYHNHPEIVPLAEDADQYLEDFTRNFVPNAGARDGGYTIPVVFHVVHNNGSENISYDQIVSSINTLNTYYNAENPSANQVHSAFQDIVANVGFNFALATIDPNGNCTNGVTRTVSTTTYIGGNNLTEVAPSWDRSMYLNVWVCDDIESGAAAYSRRPSAVDGAWGVSIDGIVARADYVGTIGEGSAARATTMPHEVGHWLNLKHTWGGTNDSAEAANCNSDDNVSDTPNTIGWTTCSNLNGESCGSLDNIENIMEYSGCRKMFTQGQADRMEAALNSSVAQRSSLWQPSNLIATGVDNEPALCTVQFSSSRRTVCVGEEIEFIDDSYGGVSTRTWNFEGGTPAVSTEASTAIMYNTPGVYAVSLAVSDNVNSLETLEEAFITVLDTAHSTLPFSEGFEGNTEIGDEGSIWYTENETTASVDWEITSDAAYTGNNSAYVHGRENTNGATELMLSQTFDLSGVTDEVSFTFKYACAKRYAGSNDVLKVLVSKNCGEYWSTRATIQGDDLYTVLDNVSGEFVPNGQDEWREITVPNIASAYYTSSFRVRFEFISGNGNNVYIDDINIEDLSSPTSTEDVERFRSALKVFPNPASNSLTVELAESELNAQMEINLLDISGRTIKTVYQGDATNSSRRLNIDISDLSSGLYFLDFNHPGGRFAEKIVVRD